MKTVKTRFAPSPTGLLHIGNVRTALFNFLFARKTGGQFLLRIEDTDAERSRPEYVDSLIEDLKWLGLEWDEGPVSADQPEHCFQSRRGGIYHRYYEELHQRGLIYPCFCSPRELELSRKAQLGAGRPPRYSGKCAHLSEEEVAKKFAQGLEATLRFRVNDDAVVEFEDLVRGTQRFNTSDIGDFIIRRADGTPAFFFCNAIDDALMGVTHVMRGEDHLANTPRQILLLQALELPVPVYGHISLILGSDGTPLSKRNGSVSVREMREQGYLPVAVVNLLSRLGHYCESNDVLGLEHLARGFNLAALGRAPARFDPAQLRFWQDQSVRGADDATLWQWLSEATRERIPESSHAMFLDVVRNNCSFPPDAERWAEILFGTLLQRDAAVAGVALEAGADFYRSALDALECCPDDSKGFLEELKNRSGVKGKGLFQPLRAALTGRLDGPEIGKIFTLLGRERMQRRLAEFV